MTTEQQTGPSFTYTDRDCPRVAVLDGQDQFDGMEEQVFRRVAKHHREALTTYLPTTDNSGNDKQTATQPPEKNTKAQSCT